MPGVARLAHRKHTNMGFGGALEAAQEKFVLFAARVQDKEH
jgi:hypothetical protein